MAKTILIIEDEEAIQGVVKAFLEDEGYNVVLASDGLEGMEKFREYHPDLILLDLMLAVVRIVQGMVSTIITQSGLSGSTGTTLPQEIIDKINDVGFWDSIPLWAVTLLGGLFITVLSFIMILTVYSRMFKLYMYTAIAPVPLSSFAGEPTSNVGKNFLRSYAGVCLEGAIIALACIIFSVMATSPPAVDPNVSAVTAVWSYVGELIFNLLVLVGAVRMSDRIVKEILGL